MKKCPRCHQEILDTDKKCPHCGYILGYQNENKQQGQYDFQSRKVNFARRIVFYSLIAGFVFGPSLFNSYMNSSSMTGQVVDQSVGANELPVYIYTSLEAYQGDYPDSLLVAKSGAFETELAAWLQGIDGTIIDSYHQVTITNTNSAYVMAGYDLDIAGTAFNIELDYNNATQTSSLMVKTSQYGIAKLADLSLSETNNVAFQQLTAYLGFQSAPLYGEAIDSFNEVVASSQEDVVVGGYGLGVNLHNNGSQLGVYYATDLVSGGENPGYVLDLKFTSKINDDTLGKLR